MRYLPLLIGILLLLIGCEFFKPAQTDPPAQADPQPTTPAQGDASFQYWNHHPMHPANQQAVEFKLKAAESTGISKVELWLYEFELYQDVNGLPSKRRRTGGKWGRIKKWEFPQAQDSIELAHFYAQGFSAASNAEYVFKVFNQNNEVSERMAIFDAGQSPWPQDKILLYATSPRPLHQTINLCFLPDTDYGNNWELFLQDVAQLITEGYHANNKIAQEKMSWSFFYTRQAVDGLALSQDFANEDVYPAFMKDSIIHGIDAFGLLHQEAYSDGAYLYGNIHFLAQNLFTSEGYNWGTAVHESGHAIFNLSDEYNGCACFEAEGGSNVFPDLEACRRFNRLQGFDPGDCRAIQNFENANWYIAEPNAHFENEATCQAFNRANGFSETDCELFIDVDGARTYRSPEAVCIMQDDGDRRVPDFQRVCSYVIDHYYDRLRLQTEPIALTEDRENMYGYEPVVLAELQIEKGKWQVEMERMDYGVPTKNLKKQADFKMEIMDARNRMAYQLNSDRPDCIHIHDGTDSDRRFVTGAGRSLLVLPYIKGMSTIKCQGIALDDSQPMDAAKMDLQMDVGEKVKKMMDKGF